MSHEKEVSEFFAESIQILERAKDDLAKPVAAAAHAQATCIGEGHKILIAGNGGSAADSLHYAGELLNKFRRKRRPLAAVCLAADISAITSIANDESFDMVFAKQVEALGKAGDMLVVLTTSGNSKNIIEAVQAAHKAGMRCVALSGSGGGPLGKIMRKDDFHIIVGDGETSRIQEVHGVIIHAFCDLIDRQLFAGKQV